MSDHARTVLAFVGMHPLRRRTLEARLGGADALVGAIAAGEIDTPSTARAAARTPAVDLIGSLDDTRLVLDGDPGYPAALAELPDRPDAIFVRGAIPEPPGVAVVGSRAVTAYGVECATRIASVLGRHGYPIISGLARGVDTVAHRAALDVEAATLAVLGCGIDRWYPAANRGLGERILSAGGGVISEYPPGTPPAPWRFPLRNRIVSGVSAAVVVVEASVRGGALITARSALAQGREVLAVPGDIDRATSGGTNRLIADGALPVVSLDHVVEAVDRITGQLRLPPVAAHPLAEVIGVSATVEELTERLGMSVGEVLATVGRWEVEGLVRVDGERVTTLST